MAKASPLPTQIERRYAEIHDAIEDVMMRKVYSALQEAAAQARTETEAAGLDLPPGSSDFFASVIHQKLYCLLCKADPATFAGGRADIAIAIIRNSQNIAKHYWGAAIEPHPAGGPAT